MGAAGVAGLPQPQGEAWRRRGCCLWASRARSPAREPPPSQDAVETADATPQAWDAARPWLGKQGQGLRQRTPIAKDVLWVKCSQTALWATWTLLLKGRAHRCSRLHRCLVLRSCPSCPSLRPPPPDQPAATSIGARPSASNRIVTRRRRR